MFVYEQEKGCGTETAQGEERIPEDEEDEIYEMLEVINNRKRRTYE